MPDYRYFAFGADNHIKRRVDIVADTDELAIIEARALYVESQYRGGFEVWDRSRAVHQEDRESQKRS